MPVALRPCERDLDVLLRRPLGADLVTLCFVITSWRIASATPACLFSKSLYMMVQPCMLHRVVSRGGRTSCKAMMAVLIGWCCMTLANLATLTSPVVKSIRSVRLGTAPPACLSWRRRGRCRAP